MKSFMSWQNTIKSQVVSSEWNRIQKLFEKQIFPRHAANNSIHQLYLPLYFLLQQKLHEKRSTKDKNEPLIIGLSCPQGGGKSTLVRYLETIMSKESINFVQMSMDDLYLDHEQQEQLAQQYEGNKLLEFRGNPGTHDLPLSLHLFDQLKIRKPIKIPRYDKSAYNGRGDRLPESRWIPTTENVDIFFLEGWCLGFQHVPEQNILTKDLLPINQALEEYNQLYKQLDLLIVMEIEELNWVYKWREGAENESRQLNKPALSSNQVKDFVDRFMPSYRQYLPRLYQDEKLFLQGAPHSIEKLLIPIDSQRIPIETIE